ncbi:MAG: hypothetical protein N2Z80_02455 [Hydrogenothermaceae bacterium]|nr:hypothetical protein [Hydrogenothermaceae bacterium]
MFINTQYTSSEGVILEEKSYERPVMFEDKEEVDVDITVENNSFFRWQSMRSMSKGPNFKVYFMISMIFKPPRTI